MIAVVFGLYSCIGFGASFLGTLLFGVTLDQFGGTSLRYLRPRVPGRCRRHHSPAPEYLAAVTPSGRSGDQQVSGPQRNGYAATGAGVGRAFNSNSATSALRLRPAEIASTPMPM